MSLLIAFAVLSIAVSFICSILEATLLSVTPSYIAQQKEAHPKRHEQLNQLKNQIDQPLAAILTLNTVAHTVGALGVGAQVTVVFGNGYLGIASAVMTILILVLSEILPKTIGARFWRTLAPVMPPVLNFMIWILKPFIWISDWMMRLIGDSSHQGDIRSEIKAMAQLGRELDELDEDESRVIFNILDLHEMKIRDIMTPRTVCEYVEPNETVADFMAQYARGQFSRYPVIEPEEESPLGVVFRRDIIGVEDDKLMAEVMMKSPLVVADQTDVETVMAQLMRERQHMAMVYDEYGTWMGIVTMEDIFETLIGKSIVDETDDIPNMRRFARKRWEKRQRNSAAASQSN